MTDSQIFKRTKQLNTGQLIPQLGLGTSPYASDEEGYTAVKGALNAGYRHIDTARAYNNEEIVGSAIRDFIKESGVPRSEIHVTTKLWCTEFKDPVKGIKGSLKRLGLDYVDLYLMHWPIVMAEGEEWIPKDPDGTIKLVDFDEWNYLDTYKAMQRRWI
ncbi:DEKNAAC103157 [Brettanomyces naardenensis]|uniref:DEKNAAC103157 n=1 Tax=Brettanomyces naardenensis TaxID=13370 RepID=A0A448YME1_BRENA|nr:DEKNAAC103157 [Brettanomyces naardenensis]